MQAQTFRKWLAERGCTFEEHARGKSAGHPSVTVRREGRRAELPMVGTKDDIDPTAVRTIVDALGLDWSELPGPQSRV
jgi:hypothetical protein